MRLPAKPLPEPDLRAAERHEIVIKGGMMSMSGMGMGMNGAAWATNGISMTGDRQCGMPPLFTLVRGRSCVLALRNENA